MSNSAIEMAGKFQASALAMQNGTREGVFAGALAAKRIFIQSAAAAGLSKGSRVAGGRWGVGFKMFPNAVVPSARVSFRGPVHLVDRATRPHGPILPRRRGRRAILTPHGPRASAQHPGTSGKGFFDKGKAVIFASVPKVVKDANRRRLVGIWGR